MRKAGSEKKVFDCDDCRNGEAFWFGWLAGRGHSQHITEIGGGKVGLGVVVDATQGNGGR